jgi:DNA-binding transcriptional MocR family regulator
MADPTVKSDNNTKVENLNDDSPKKLINLLRGWPSPALHPTSQLQAAACRALSDPSIAVPALQYAPDPGYQPLREELARWLSMHYPAPPAIKPDQIAITGGASQGLACVLQSFTDPGYTRTVWANAPCYHLVCPIFEDAGFARRLRAVPEDEGGIDVAWLARALREEDEKKKGGEVGRLLSVLSGFRRVPSVGETKETD